MTAASPPMPVRRWLDPVDRVSEVIFGLIMALSFTGALSVASAGRENVRTLLVGVLGCNAAWGFVDGAMYMLTSMLLRNKELIQLRDVRAARDPAEGVRVLVEAMSDRLVEALGPSVLERVRQELVRGAEPPARTAVTLRDVQGALSCFVITFISTFPVVLPFVLIADARLALRTASAVAIVLLFFAGWSLGRWAGFRPLRSGLVMVVLGLVLTGVTIALGG